MRSKRFFGLLTLSLLFMAGCAKDEAPGMAPGGDGSITFNISIADGPGSTDGGQTRVATNAAFESTWEDGDAIGIFARALTGNLASSGNHIHNARLTYDSGSGAWSLDEGVTLTFPKDNTKLVFHAYYPYDENAADPTAITFAVKADQNDKTGERSHYGASDLLTAISNNSGAGYEAGDQVTLTFTHALAMVQVKVDNSTEMLDTEDGTITAKLVGVKTSATLNLATPVATVSGTADNDVTMYRVEQPAATSITFRALVPVQTLVADAQLFEISDGTNTLQNPALTSPITLTAAQAELFAVGMPPLPDEQMNITIDGTTSAISAKQIVRGMYEISPGGDGSGLVESITIGNKTYLIGRKNDETVTLKIDPSTGDLQFRDPVGGKIPVSAYAELALIGASATNLQNKVNYLQEADLDLLGAASLGDGRQNWMPIGYRSQAFEGSYDGGGHTIANLYIDRTGTDFFALFGALGLDGKLSRIGIVSGTVKGSNNVGSVCGHNDGAITACYNSSAVSGRTAIGGVCGYNMYGKVTACYNTGPVWGEYRVGGVCGYNNTGTITACYNIGSVSGGKDGSIGGVLGGGSSTTTASYHLRSGTEGTGVTNAGSGTAFSDTAWPTTTTHTAWRTTTNNGADGRYWKELSSAAPLGGWVGDPNDNGVEGGNSVFPKLWWEE